ncbi:polysaccharide lyase, partial [Bacteriovoracaceae bacterium]|nr:polysaccharide lyase [Bacteriovoracaceae bacterium]
INNKKLSFVSIVIFSLMISSCRKKSISQEKVQEKDQITESLRKASSNSEDRKESRNEDNWNGGAGTLNPDPDNSVYPNVTVTNSIFLTHYVKKLEIQINGTNDDIEIPEGQEIDFDSSDLEMIEDGDIQTVGLRFNDIQLNNESSGILGLMIYQAYIQFTARKNTSGSCPLQFRIENASNSEEFTTANEFDNRNWSDQGVSYWEPKHWLADQRGYAQRIAVNKIILQNIMSQTDWESGNSLSYKISGLTSCIRKAYSFDQDSDPGLNLSPKLVIYYLKPHTAESMITHAPNIQPPFNREYLWDNNPEHLLADFDNGSYHEYKNIEECGPDNHQFLQESNPKPRSYLRLILNRDECIVAGSQRTELSKSFFGPMSIEGNAQNISSSFMQVVDLRFPDLQQPDEDPYIFFQYHGTRDEDMGEESRPPNVSASVVNNKLAVKVRWDPNPFTPPDGSTIQKSETHDILNIDYGNWHTWSFFVHWSYTSSGVVQIWRDGVLIYERVGPNAYNDQLGPYSKIGIYNYRWEQECWDNPDTWDDCDGLNPQQINQRRIDIDDSQIFQLK